MPSRNTRSRRAPLRAGSSYELVTAQLCRLGCETASKAWRCPAHEDTTPSLSVTHRTDRTLIHCFAGCSTPDVVASLGLAMRDLFDR